MANLRNLNEWPVPSDSRNELIGVLYFLGNGNLKTRSLYNKLFGLRGLFYVDNDYHRNFMNYLTRFPSEDAYGVLEWLLNDVSIVKDILGRGKPVNHDFGRVIYQDKNLKNLFGNIYIKGTKGSSYVKDLVSLNSVDDILKGVEMLKTWVLLGNIFGDYKSLDEIV